MRTTGGRMFERLHHIAYRCRDAQRTVDFYTKVVGLKYVAGLMPPENHKPSWPLNEPGQPARKVVGEEADSLHIFFELGDGSYLAFFDVPDGGDDSNDPTPWWVKHIAFEGSDMKALAVVSTLAWGQSYPAKPIRLLLTFSSGGQADLLARTVVEKMRASLPQPIIVEPRPGAGGNLAMEAVAKAPPDGTTLVFGTPAGAINGQLYKQIGYDPLKELVPISLAAWGPYVVYASGTLPVNSMAELIAYAKAKPGELNYASVGVGSGTHLAAVLFTLAAGVQMTHVPYKGIQQIAPDLVSGSVHLTFNAFGPLAQFVQSGRVKMLATTNARRIPSLPEVPTIAESGLSGFEAAGWYGFFTTAGTPREGLARLNTEVVKALNDRELAERIEKMGLVPSPQTLEEAARFVAAEAEKWGPAVAASVARAE